MGLIKLGLLALTPGLANSTMKRMTSFDIQPFVVSVIPSETGKQWVNTYFSLNDKIFDKGAEFMGFNEKKQINNKPNDEKKQ